MHRTRPVHVQSVLGAITAVHWEDRLCAVEEGCAVRPVRVRAGGHGEGLLVRLIKGVERVHRGRSV